MPTRRPALWSLILGLLHALLFGLAFPPFGLWPLAFIAAAPLMVVALRTPCPARSALMVGLATLPMWLFHQRWLIDVTGAGYPALCVFLAVWPGLFVWIAARVRRTPFLAASLVVMPVIWTGIEFFHGTVFMHGYPWFLLAHPTIDAPLWPAFAELVGAYGVSLLTAVVNAVVAALFDGSLRAKLIGAVRRRPRRVVGSFVIVVGLGCGVAAVLSPPGWGAQQSQMIPGAWIAVIQTNVPQDNKIIWTLEQRLADLERFSELTRQAAAADPKPHLIVWPETMFPGFSLNEAAVEVERAAGLSQRLGDRAVPTTLFHDELLRLQAEVGIPMLVGAIARDGMRIVSGDDGRPSIEADAEYNSAFVIADGAVTDQRYDKISLTPFGEEMPYISRNKWLESKLLAFGAAGMEFNLTAGSRPVVLEAPLHPFGKRERRPLRIATPICFEATIPAACRRLAAGPAGRADVIINLTNDGWFGAWSGVREQHLQIARWRAIELGTPVVRAANTGISCLIDPTGKVIRRGPEGRDRADRVDGVMLALVPVGWAKPLPLETLYARTGDLVAWISLAATALLLIGALLPVSRSGLETPSNQSRPESAPHNHGDAP